MGAFKESTIDSIVYHYLVVKGRAIVGDMRIASKEQFDSKFEFHESSVEDFPEKNGVRDFTHNGFRIFVASDPIALTGLISC